MPATTTSVRKTLSELKTLGSEATRKTYLRHGASEPLFGVKFGDLNKLKKRIGIDHELAKQLWASGNSDAQTLALMVVDPAEMKSSEIDAWLRPLKYHLLVDMLAGVTANTSFATAKWTKWAKAKPELTQVAAYSLLSIWLRDRPGEVPSDVIEDALGRIETSIHDAPNYARHGMNNALIAIGVFREDYRKESFRVAKSIGKVTVDHGDTSCTTPDATAYIKKSVARSSRRRRC